MKKVPDCSFAAGGAGCGGIGAPHNNGAAHQTGNGGLDGGRRGLGLVMA
jgi:hypothetical protein